MAYNSLSVDYNMSISAWSPYNIGAPTESFYTMKTLCTKVCAWR